ncbi:MAG TPA: DegT/DnrJ/EryC1/StrS family aminotransferase [Bacteroidia bacterium]|nr:DegT/DnrJ/EryC1/StrS family aminotransferase [Bacteroidia bacterium]
MNYYFPGPIDTINIPHNTGLCKYSVNSGENAIRLVLKSFNLSVNAKVAIPLFVCDSLKTAVVKEKLQPVYLDIKDNTYWTNYDLNLLKQQQVAVVILVHLYGFIHPDTNLISEYCKQNGVFLIHDMAQCYGADESQLDFGSVVYSFGPGKSTTAAGGGLIRAIDDDFYKNHIQSPSIWSGVKAKLFLKSRICGYKFSGSDKLVQGISNRIPASAKIESMSSIQKDAAEYVMNLVKKRSAERKERYNILKEVVGNNLYLSIAYDDCKGLYFKSILYVKEDVIGFKKYLAENNVPYYCLFDSITIGLNETADKPYFIINAQRFIELSTEASVPLPEIKRVGEILSKFS